MAAMNIGIKIVSTIYVYIEMNIPVLELTWFHFGEYLGVRFQSMPINFINFRKASSEYYHFGDRVDGYALPI